MLEPMNADVTLVGRTARDGILDMEGYRRIHGDQDVIVLALPVSEDTAGMVDAEFLASMKDGAILVNAGRGGLVDTDALIAATADRTDPRPRRRDRPGTTAGRTPDVDGARHHDHTPRRRSHRRHLGPGLDRRRQPARDLCPRRAPGQRRRRAQLTHRQAPGPTPHGRCGTSALSLPPATCAVRLNDSAAAASSSLTAVW